MSAIFGPNSYLPGQKLPCPINQECDNHPGIKAVIRIVGECDSYGSELIDYCQECFDVYENNESSDSICDLCMQESVSLMPFKDQDEGTAGYIYNACPSCITANKEIISIVTEHTKNISEDDSEEDKEIDYCDEVNEDDGYSLEPTEGDPEPLNFHNPPHRW